MSDSRPPGAFAGQRERSPLEHSERDAEHHAAVAGLIAAYVDGELPSQTVAQIDSHLQVCRRCRREVTVQRQVAAELGQTRGPVASAALLTRIRGDIAQLPAAPVSPVRTASSWHDQWSITRILALVAVTVVTVIAAWAIRDQSVQSRSRASASIPSLRGNALLDTLLVSWTDVATHDLPGRARDLEPVRAAVGAPVRPIVLRDAVLTGAWTTTMQGELMAVLAYRDSRGLMLQFVLPASLVARSTPLQQAFAIADTVSAERDSVSLVAWSDDRGAQLLVSNRTASQLQALLRGK